MKKTISAIIATLAIALVLTGCVTKEPVVDNFSAEYEISGTTSAGIPKSDTFIFEGKTEDGIITELNFDIIRDKGMDTEISKKDIMGYQMNVSDVSIVKDGDNYKLTKFSAAGYDDAFPGGQYMVVATIDDINNDTKFGDLNFLNLATQKPLEMDYAIAAYKYIAVEAGLADLDEETTMSEIISKYDLYENDSFVQGDKRISFAGYNGGRSYGEQIDAIAAYILEEKMTLEDVYEMFKTVNPLEQPISERDTISGATISFVGDFQRMVYLAIHGELFEGVLKHSETNGNTVVEVVTQGYGGEVEANVVFDSEGKVIDIIVRDAQETPDIGETLTLEDSAFITSLISKQDALDEVEAVSGATVTSEALSRAVELAIKYYKGL